MVEALDPPSNATVSTLNICKVFDNLYMLWIHMDLPSYPYHRTCWPRYGKLVKILGRYWQSSCHHFIYWWDSRPTLNGVNLNFMLGVCYSSYAMDGHMVSSCYQGTCWSRLRQLAEIWHNCWATNDAMMPWLRLLTHLEMIQPLNRTYTMCFATLFCCG